MNQQMFNCDVLLAGLAEFRDIARHRVTESELSVFCEDHDGGCRGHDLCQRCEIKDRIDRHRLRCGHQGPLTISFTEDDLALTPNEDHCARQLTFLNLL